MKIGMYTEDEIFEYMTDCEGSMLGRSMYDAIFDKIHALKTENEQLKQDKKFYADAFVNLRNRNDKALSYIINNIPFRDYNQHVVDLLKDSDNKDE